MAHDEPTSEHAVSPAATNRPSGRPTRDTPARATPRRDAVSLVTGAVFLGLAGGWALTWLDVMPYTSLGWYLPLLLVIAGLLGVLVPRRRP